MTVYTILFFIDKRNIFKGKDLASTIKNQSDHF